MEMASESEKKVKEQFMLQPEQGPQNFEDIISAMGPPGRYQIIQCVLLGANFIPVVFINYVFVFIGLEPSFSCSSSNETSFLQTHPSITNETGPYQFSYGECDIHITSNASGTSKDVARVGCLQGYSYHGGKHVSLITEWDLVCNASGTAELSQSLMSVGWFFGLIVASMFADKYGRKKTVRICIAMFSISELGSAFAPNIYIFIILRFFSGFVAAGITGVTYVLGAEHLVSRNRGRLILYNGVVWSTYAVVTCVTAYVLRNNSWRHIQMCVAFSALLPFVCLYFVDESASWLYSEGKHHQATLIVKKACRINGLDFMKIQNTWDQLCTHEIKQQKDEKEAKNYNMLDIFRNKRLRIYAFIAWVASFTNETSYYGMYLSASTLAGDLYLNTTIMTLLDVPGCFVIITMLKFKGRRFVMMFFMSMAAICLLVSTCLGPDVTPHRLPVAYTSTVFFLLGRFAIGNSYNTLVLYIPEIFPTTLRSSGRGLCGTGACIGAMLAPYMNPLHNVASWAPGVFLTCTVTVSMILLFKLPETKGRQMPSTINEPLRDIIV